MELIDEGAPLNGVIYCIGCSTEQGEALQRKGCACEFRTTYVPQRRVVPYESLMHKKPDGAVGGLHHELELLISIFSEAMSCLSANICAIQIEGVWEGGVQLD